MNKIENSPGILSTQMKIRILKNVLDLFSFFFLFYFFSQILSLLQQFDDFKAKHKQTIHIEKKKLMHICVSALKTIYWNSNWHSKYKKKPETETERNEPHNLV